MIAPALSGAAVAALLGTSAGGVPVLPVAPISVAVCAVPAESVVAAPAPPTLFAPPLARGMTRVQGTLRPFLGLTGNSWGAVTDARIEHYFRAPFMLGVEIAPLAVAVDRQGAGGISHARVQAAYVTDFVAVGLGLGGKLQRYGPSGLSVAPSLRLGSLDGLSFSLTYGYGIARNHYTGQRTVGFSNALANLTVPLGSRLALQLDGGFSLNQWVFATAGLRHRVAGDGGPGSWFVTGGFGGAWVVDRAPCDYSAEIPCGDSALSFGPTISVGLDRRF